MDQYAININANAGSTLNLSFEELQYRLLNGEIMVGDTLGFPIKKNIENVLINYDGIVSTSGIGDTSPSDPFYINLSNFIGTYFPNNIGDGINGDKGVSFEVDLRFFMNHYYYNPAVAPNKLHYSLTGNMLLRFNVLKTNAIGFVYKPSAVQIVSQSFAWVQYDSSRKMYDGVLDSGSQLTGNTTPMVEIYVPQSNASASLRVNNVLREIFSNYPQYIMNLQYTIKAYQLDQSDYTTG